MNVGEMNKILDDIRKMTNEEIVVFIALAKNRGLTFDADYLRLILIDIKNS